MPDITTLGTSSACKRRCLMAPNGSDAVKAQEAPEKPKDNGTNGDAFVSLLFGDDPKWLLCALLLGYQLWRFCSNKARYLLIGKECKWFEPDAQAAKALSLFWTLRLVDLKCLPNATRTMRHKYAFTKLLAFEVEEKHVLFLDLDLLVRSNKISELFAVRGPAGALHGDPTGRRWRFAHGEVINSKAFDAEEDPKGRQKRPCCINAGVLRLDPPENARARRELVSALFQKAGEILETNATFLPEQYFLVKELQGIWRQIGVRWNWEVGPDVTIHSDYSVAVHTKCEWATLGCEDAVVLHFSGVGCDPCNYLDLEEEEIESTIKSRYTWRDSKSRISFAVIEWVRAVRGLHAEASRLAAGGEVSPECRISWKAVCDQVSDAMGILRSQAEKERRWNSGHCEWCERWTWELFRGYLGWICSGCILVHQCLYATTPPLEAGNGPFVGRWLDEKTGHDETAEDVVTISLQSGALHVKLRQWVGIMTRSADDEVTIKWESDDDEEWIDEGWLRGRVIDFPRHNSRWARIMSFYQDAE